MSTEKGFTDPESMKRLEREVEKQQAITGIMQTEVQEILKLQKEALSLTGNAKNWKVAYAAGTAGTIMTIFADSGKFLHLVRVILAATTTAASSILLNLVDRNATAYNFCQRIFGVASGTERFNEILDFGGVRLDNIRSAGATFNVMPSYDMEVGDGRTSRFTVSVTGTGTFCATVIYYEGEGATY